ncbi:hypothetical protein Sango_2298100 [Sesamum angolense]|uniref:RNase H type-1 domain-containing protein n=1 Tax=Sesamum angolense TaxID=2727404 RepID=A0AAE1WAM4_9LAMI|nr:hypothetical protein Sango_2298100 [Sesamum angolense]
MAGISLGDTPEVEKWLLHVDGSSTIQSNSTGIVITSPHGENLEFAVKFCFKVSNNETKYDALVIGMKMAYSDSQLIVQHVEGAFKAKEENMIQYLQILREEISRLTVSPSSLILYSRAPLAVQLIPYTQDWRTPLVRWLEEGCFPDNRWEVARLNT